MSAAGPGSTVGARRFVVKGRVQGVGFRYFVEHRARELGLAGFARNLQDGRVEVVAQGDPRALARLAGVLRQGPPLSRVDDLDEHDVDTDPDRVGFGIRF